MTICSFSNQKFTVEVSTNADKFVTALFRIHNGIYKTIESNTHSTLEASTEDFRSLVDKVINNNLQEQEYGEEKTKS